MNCKCGMAMEVHNEDFATKSAVCPCGHREYLYLYRGKWETKEERMERMRKPFICKRCGEKAFDYTDYDTVVIGKVCGACYGAAAERRTENIKTYNQMRHINNLKKRSKSPWAQFNFVKQE